MATSKEYIEYVVGQIQANSSYRKIFGEYMIYIDGKPVLLVCDDIVFVKILPETKVVLGNDAEKGYPYDGAKEHYIIDPDDREIFNEIISVLRRVIPLPKKRGK